MRKIFLLVALLLLSCQPSVIEIALFSKSSEALEKYAEGIELAIDAINSEGGIGGHNIKLSICKNGLDEVAEKNLSALFLGPSNESIIKKAVQLSKNKSIPLFFLFPYFKGGENNLFISGDIASETNFLSNAAAYSLHSNFVLVVEFEERLAKCYSESFEKNGGKVETLNCLQLSPDEIKKKLEEIFSKKENPQIIFFAGFEEENIEPFKEVLKKSIIMAPFSFYVLNNLGTYEEALTTLSWFDEKKKTGKIAEFQANYENKYGHKGGNLSLLSYEAVFLLKNLPSYNTQEQNIEEKIKNNPLDFELSGKLFFDNYGVLNRRASLAVERDGEIKDLSIVERDVLKGLQEKVVQERIKK